MDEIVALLALQAEGSKFVGGDKPQLTHSGDVREKVRAEIARSSEWSGYRNTLADLLDQCGDSHPDIMPGGGHTREMTAEAAKEPRCRTPVTIALLVSASCETSSYCYILFAGVLFTLFLHSDENEKRGCLKGKNA